MGQRLGIASALLGDPDTVILDEPVNGLDPEGIHWIRNLLKGLAAEGRTVFVSSHLMSEMALTADHLIVIGRGRLIADTSVDDFIEMASARARPRPHAGGGTLSRRCVGVPTSRSTATRPDVLEVHGPLRRRGRRPRVPRTVSPIYELTPQQASLEEAFMNLTRDAVEFGADGPPDTEGSQHERRRRTDRPAAAAHRQGHAGAGHRVGVDEALVAPLDALLDRGGLLLTIGIAASPAASSRTTGRT